MKALYALFCSAVIGLSLPSAKHDGFDRHVAHSETFLEQPALSKSWSDSHYSTKTSWHSGQLVKRVILTTTAAEWEDLATWTALQGLPADWPNDVESQRANTRTAAQEFYNAIKKLPGADPTIAAALYIPCYGIYYGTIPHDYRGADTNSQAMFAESASKYAVNLWSRLRGREAKTGFTGSIYHAEDMAAYVFESTWMGLAETANVDPNGERLPDHWIGSYPAGSFIAAYGKYSTADLEGSKVLCGQTIRGGNIDPPCSEVFAGLGVGFDSLRTTHA